MVKTIQHGRRKVVITGDFLRVPYEDNPLLYDADVMFLDANTWRPADWTWHQSVLGNLRLIEKWRPKRAYLVHYSGYEDREDAAAPINGPFSVDQFGKALRGLRPDLNSEPARHGMILGDGEPWP
jgi:hypothetical protein